MRTEVGKFSEVGVMAMFRFTAHLNDCRTECTNRYCTLALSLFNLPISGIQRWFADTARGKVCDFAFLTSSGGKFFICVGHTPSNREQ